jgi:hypothetical protein
VDKVLGLSKPVEAPAETISADAPAPAEAAAEETVSA